MGDTKAEWGGRQKRREREGGRRKGNRIKKVGTREEEIGRRRGKSGRERNERSIKETIQRKM